MERIHYMKNEFPVNLIEMILERYVAFFHKHHFNFKLKFIFFPHADDKQKVY